MDEFDFWVGEWEVYAGDKLAGVNRIEKLHDGAVIVENWTGTSGATGISLNFYDPALGKWRQTYVANDRTIWEMTGECRDGAMRFEGDLIFADGNLKKTRVTFYNLERDRLRHTEDNSSDGGQTWVSVWDAIYSRIMVSGKTPLPG